MRCAELNLRPLGYDAGRINGFMRVVVVLFDLVKIDGLGDAGLLVKIAQVAP